jgi:hypothetical protein
MHELEQLVDDRLEELPVIPQEAWVLAHNIPAQWQYLGTDHQLGTMHGLHAPCLEMRCMQNISSLVAAVRKRT